MRHSSSKITSIRDKDFFTAETQRTLRKSKKSLRTQRLCGQFPSLGSVSRTEVKLALQAGAFRSRGGRRRTRFSVSREYDVLQHENVSSSSSKTPKINLLATLTLHLRIPLSASLKEKRGRIKPLVSRLRREFNVSVAEMDLHDHWQEAVIVCAMVGNDRTFLQSALQTVAKWVEANWTDGDVWDTKIEMV